MNLENIKVGDKFSTEKKLLIAVGFEKYDGNKQKEYQLKELKRYLTYEKTGKISRGKPTNEIVVTEIFNTPKEKMDNRNNNGGNNTSIISDYIYNEIAMQLNECNEFSFSIGSLIRHINLVTPQFYKTYYNTKINSFKDSFVVDFCENVMKSLRTRVKNIIKNMQEKDEIDVAHYYTVLYKLKDGTPLHVDITDDNKIKKIDEIRKECEIEVLHLNDDDMNYDVEEMWKKQRWQIYGNRTSREYFSIIYNSKLESVLNKNLKPYFVRCYCSVDIAANEDNYLTRHLDNNKFYNAMEHFTNRCINTTINAKNYVTATIDGRPQSKKVLKYLPDKISDDVISYCNNLIPM